MAFLPPVVGCLVKKGLQKGGVTGTPEPPWLRPCDLAVPSLRRKKEVSFFTCLCKAWPKFFLPGNE